MLKPKGPESNEKKESSGKFSKLVAITTATAVVLGEVFLGTVGKDITKLDKYKNSLSTYNQAVKKYIAEMKKYKNSLVLNIPEDFYKKAKQAFYNGNYELSENLLKHTRNSQKKAKMTEQIKKKKDSFLYKWQSVKNCARTTFSLETYSNGSLFNEGCNFVVDFTVTGDVKDILRYYKGENISSLTLGLSILGVGLTAATIASWGASAPVKGGVKIVKDLSKTGKKIPGYILRSLEKFTNNILSYIDKTKFNTLSFTEKGKYLEEVFQKSLKDVKELKGLTKIFESIGTLIKNTDYNTALRITEKVKDEKKLFKLAKLSEKYGNDIKLFVKTYGENFLKAFNKYGEKIDFKTFQEAFKRKNGFKKLGEYGPDFMKKISKPKKLKIIKPKYPKFSKVNSKLIKLTSRVAKALGKSLKELLELLQNIIYVLGAVSIASILNIIRKKRR